MAQAVTEHAPAPVRVPLQDVQRAHRRRLRWVMLAALLGVGAFGTLVALVSGPLHSREAAVATILAIPALCAIWVSYLFYQRRRRRLHTTDA